MPEGSHKPPRDPKAPITRIVSPVRLDFTIHAGIPKRLWLQGLLEGKILGQRCEHCGKVYVPPGACCPTCMEPLHGTVELSQTGTVTTFCVINIPFEGQVLEPPYVGSAILLDGADLPLFHLVGGVDAAQVRMGMRVKAHWAPPEEWGPTLENIRYFVPTGEPDADFSTIASHL